MPEPLIVTLGDALALALISPERAMLPSSSAPAETVITVGGQAAIAACWAVATGARARCLSARAYDRLGDLLEAELADRGVELQGPGVDGRTGLAAVVRVPGARRTALTDRGVCPQLSADALQPDWIDDADVLHVSGYAMLDQPSAGAAERAVELARAAGARVSVDLACADIVSPLVRERLLALRADIAFATPAQAEAIGGADDLAALPVVTDAAAGAADPMGVADAYAAGYLAAIAAGADPDDADELGREMAGRCGAGDGPVP